MRHIVDRIYYPEYIKDDIRSIRHWLFVHPYYVLKNKFKNLIIRWRNMF